ncbi:MAG: ComEC/Rec2 family competence protein, partial [Candidatus Cloacimonadota bacterium]|nr:ComEC/Rec2 family competence protein [Candidatus Cloacimonadota bacterium]
MKGREAPPPFAVFALFWSMGLIVAHLFDIPILLSLSIAFFLLLTSLFKKNTVILLLVIFLFAALHYELQQTKPVNHLSILLEKNGIMRQPIQGKIISEKEENHYLLDIETIRNIPVEGKAFLYYDADTLVYGDIVETIADIFPIPRNSNPAAFNYRQYLETKQIYAYAIAKTKIKILGNQSNFLNRYVIRVRVWIREQISKKFSQNSAFVKAILLGDKKDLGEDKHNYIKAGLSHIFAVSGLHVGIISSVFFIILHLFIKHKPTIRIILIIVLLFYAAICQWRASVFRAVIMLSVYFIAKNIQRKTIPNNILALSLMIITLINPAQLFTPGFLLSFIAVFTLVNFIPKFRFITLQKEDLKSMSYIKKIINWTALVSISSLLLGISLAPITIYFFNHFSLNGTVANIIAMPLMGIILLPLAMIIIILPFGWELYESAFQLFYEILENWVNFSGNLPLYFEFVSISSMQVILLYFAFYLLYKICRKDKFKTNFSL